MQAQTTKSHITKKSKSSSKSKSTVELSPIGQVVCQGISHLIKGQLQFSQEFGLARQRVFPESCQALQGQSIESLISSWLTTDIGEHLLQVIFNELVEHQLALVATLDEIAMNTIAYCEYSSSKNIFLQTIEKYINLTHKRRFEELRLDQKLRYQEIIAPGIITFYSQFRELNGFNK